MEAQEARLAGLKLLRAFAEVGGDLGEMTDAIPAFTAYVEHFGTPDFTCSLHSTPPTPAIEYHGVAAIERAVRDWSETFTSVRATLDEVVELEHATALLVTQIGITRHGGVEVTQPSALVWKLRGGRVARLELHLDQDEALRSAALQ